jgi:hypothetical protein
MVIRAAILAAVIAAGGEATVHASVGHARPRMTTVTFRLRVQTAPPPQMTFWVAYGPPAPRFGVVRLLPAGSGQYVGSRALPSGARASFTYLAAWGSVRTPAGAMPGNPVTVIKRTVRLQIGLGHVPEVVWKGPVG